MSRTELLTATGQEYGELVHREVEQAQQDYEDPVPPDPVAPPREVRQERADEVDGEGGPDERERALEIVPDEVASVARRTHSGWRRPAVDCLSGRRPIM